MHFVCLPFQVALGDLKDYEGCNFYLPKGWQELWTNTIHLDKKKPLMKLIATGKRCDIVVEQQIEIYGPRQVPPVWRFRIILRHPVGIEQRRD